MKIQTKFGMQNGQPDSMIGYHETLTDGENAAVNETGSKKGVDDVPAKANDAAVMGNLNWPFASILAGRPISFAEASYAAGKDIELFKKNNPEPSDDIQKRRGTGSAVRNTTAVLNRREKRDIGKQQQFMKFAMSQQKQVRDALGYNNIENAKCGKDLPKYAFGADRLGNLITSGLGVLGGIGQIISANGQRLNNPEIYSPNQYERQSLTTLAGLRDNPYNQLKAMQDVEARNRYATSQSGGLTGAQKYLANVAGGIGLQKNYADVLYRSNEANNKYKAAWASAAMQAGLANAQRMQQSNQYRDEAYARSHAAREQLRQMGMQNILGQVQQYYSNEFKRNQFNRMMDLYWAEQDAKHPKYNIDDVKKNVKFTAPSINDFMNTPVPEIKYKPTPLDPLLRMTPSEFKKYFG